jgi:hypothetical protein
MSGTGGTTLPNVYNAYVPDAKVRDYLLDPNHPGNGGKHKFFQLFGFSQSRWTVLQNALSLHPQTNPVVKTSPNPYGTRYEVKCSLVSPDGRNPCITTVWVMDPLSSAPRMITAYP